MAALALALTLALLPLAMRLLIVLADAMERRIERSDYWRARFEDARQFLGDGTHGT